MPCACSLPSRTITSAEESLLPGVWKNASRLCVRRVFIMAIVCFMVISWPLLAYAKAQAGFESFLVEYHYDKAEGGRPSRKLSTDDELKGTAVSAPKYWNRKFLREGSDSTNKSRMESTHGLINVSPRKAPLGPSSGKFSGRHSNTHYRRILIPASNECTNKDISITQRRDGSPGIPRFSVQIVNTCVSDCAPADVHVYCGWFASSPPPNPNTFQRLTYNDCLVNGGRPLGHGAIIQFEYANSFMYPMRFRSASFCR